MFIGLSDRNEAYVRCGAGGIPISHILKYIPENIPYPRIGFWNIFKSIVTTGSIPYPNIS